MNNNELVYELKNFQKYIGELISHYEINEALCDFFDSDRTKFNQYGRTLGNISEALCYRQHMLCYLLFYNDKDSKSIPKMLNKIIDNSLPVDVNTSKQVKNIASSIKSSLALYAHDIEMLKEYRHNVHAHWNKHIFSTEWQADFTNTHKFDYSNMMHLSNDCFEKISQIILLLGGKPFDLSLIPKKEVNFFISALNN